MADPRHPDIAALEQAKQICRWRVDFSNDLARERIIGEIAAGLRAARAAAIEEAARRAGQAAQDGRDNMAESKRFGVNSAGFNQDLGWTDAAQEIEAAIRALGEESAAP